MREFTRDIEIDEGGNESGIPLERALNHFDPGSGCQNGLLPDTTGFRNVVHRLRQQLKHHRQADQTGQQSIAFR